MPRFLYMFSYQTPEQMLAAPTADSPEESSQALFIEAASADQALGWGREISEAYLQYLFPDEKVSWKARGFDHWIETDPRQEYPADLLATLQVVAHGSFPDFDRLK